MRNRVWVLPAVMVVALAAVPSANAADTGAGGNTGIVLRPADRKPTPKIAPASKEAEQALKRIRVPAGLKLDLWAAEPMLANPVSFSFDEKGRVFVAEAHRYNTSVLDMRQYQPLIEDDLAARSVEDRAANLRKWFGAQADDLAIESEILRVLEDRTGSGVANYSAVYADKFNSILDGNAAGVLARKGEVFFANIPALWKFSGTDAAGRATTREQLSYGYGLRYSFHDLHGLIIGPDGKLYFSVGDRGANVKTKEGKVLAYPDEGVVFRCNLDGSELEAVHRGVRNPQELAFDDHGNLFTGDNDFDHNDEERLVYIVEGGDTGWRVGYQYPPLGYDLVPWKAEQIWINHQTRQTDYNGHGTMMKFLEDAYISFKGSVTRAKSSIPDLGVRPAAYLKPICNIADGPSGIACNPGGTALPAKFDGRFFLCHFKGMNSTSKIQSFGLKPDGAGFKLGETEEFVTQVQATDVDFGPDGALYFSDWGEGWERNGKGRLYRVYDEALFKSTVVLATRRLLAEGFEKRPVAELVKLLAQANRRVRQEAQFELVDRQAADALAGVAKAIANPLARLHAIWGLGQIARESQNSKLKTQNYLLPLLADSDAEVRAQTAKVLGDARVKDAVGALVKSLDDSNARVRFFGALALGKIGDQSALPAVVAMLAKNNNADEYVSHGGVMALAGAGDVKALAALASHGSAAVRLAAAVALRKLESPEITAFLKDADPAVVIEAVRAINDVPIVAAMPELGALLNANAPAASGKWSEFFFLRAINANFRGGDARGAEALAKFAAANSAPAEMRVEALGQLGQWAKPPRRDRVVGVFRPLPERDAAVAAAALRPEIGGLLQNAPELVRAAAAEAAGRLHVAEAGAALFSLVGDSRASAPLRVASLRALAELNDAKLDAAIELAGRAPEEALRVEANRLLAATGSAAAVQHLAEALDKGTLSEKQGAFTALGAMKRIEAENVLVGWLGKLVAGQVSAELRLDLIEAAAGKNSPQIKAGLAAYEAARAKGDDLAPYRDSLAG
ncbi:MAG: HEAT repeat domain-containing protein, partial [Verrucomicrobia bacterium]|nr:HEAT repeat domain-containing protein [Verrucomicrobiota bacterium]